MTFLKYSVIIVFAFIMSGCFISKRKYDTIVLTARNLDRQLKKVNKENLELKKHTQSLSEKKDELNEKINEYNLKIQNLSSNLEEKEKTTETLMANLTKEKESSLKELSDSQNEMTSEIKRLKSINNTLGENNRKLIENQTQLREKNEKLIKQIGELTFDNQNFATVKLAQSKEINDLMERIALLEKDLRKKEVKLEKLTSLKKEFEKSLANQIKEGSISITTKEDELKITVLSDIIFDKKNITQISPDGKSVVKKIAGLLKTIKGKKILIQGHTDSRGMGEKLKKIFPSNWDLSTARAVKVVRYLSESQHLNPKTFSAIGRSSFDPVSDNKTEQGRKKNRRIEIIISPK